jgi:hypothetical protein
MCSETHEQYSVFCLVHWAGHVMSASGIFHFILSYFLMDCHKVKLVDDFHNLDYMYQPIQINENETKITQKKRNPSCTVTFHGGRMTICGIA